MSIILFLREIKMIKMLASLLLFVAICLPLGAENLLGLEFGSSKKTADDVLTEKHYSQWSDYDDILVYIPAGNNVVLNVALGFTSQGKLEGWVIKLLGQDDFNVEEVTSAALKDLHGDEYAYDADTGEYYWDLGNKHQVTAYWDQEGDIFFVKYTTRR